MDPTCSKPLTPRARRLLVDGAEHGDGGTYMSSTGSLTTDQDCDKARRFMRAAKVAATKGAACWCPNGCDELVDLTSATPQCRVCAVEVCTTCQQKAHVGDCVAASNAADEALWRDNWQRCPGCKAVVEKKDRCRPRALSLWCKVLL